MKHLILLIICFAPAFCKAQFQMLDVNSIVVVNNSNNNVSFELKKNLDSDWINQSLEANHKITYNIEIGEELYIRLCTKQNEEDKCVSYLLERVKRYQIYWNQANRRWDVAEIKEQ